MKVEGSVTNGKAVESMTITFKLNDRTKLFALLLDTSDPSGLNAILSRDALVDGREMF